MTWMIIAIVLFIICVYLTIRVFRLRKALRRILMQLDDLKRKIPILKP